MALRAPGTFPQNSLSMETFKHGQMAALYGCVKVPHPPASTVLQPGWKKKLSFTFHRFHSFDQTFFSLLAICTAAKCNRVINTVIFTQNLVVRSSSAASPLSSSVVLPINWWQSLLLFLFVAIAPVLTCSCLLSDWLLCFSQSYKKCNSCNMSVCKWEDVDLVSC